MQILEQTLRVDTGDEFRIALHIGTIRERSTRRASGRSTKRSKEGLSKRNGVMENTMSLMSIWHEYGARGSVHIWYTNYNWEHYMVVIFEIAVQLRLEG